LLKNSLLQEATHGDSFLSNPAQCHWCGAALILAENGLYILGALSYWLIWSPTRGLPSHLLQPGRSWSQCCSLLSPHFPCVLWALDVQVS
jgi:hypothetical protein